MSCGCASRPSGTVAMNFSRCPGAEPRKLGNNGVSVATGAMAQTRMRSAASSTASDLVSVCTAPLVAL